MSFKKIQLINPWDIGCPDSGHVYFGRNDIGYWEKNENCIWYYITTGGTTGSGSSGLSGSSGRDGVDGDFMGSSGSSGMDGFGSSGSSGSSGKSGVDGTSGTSGISGSSGKSGTSGKTGSSGTTGSSGSSGMGTSGSSGSSGVDGNFYGSSGTSGFSGGYGGATRRWISTKIYPPGTSGFYGTSNWAGGFDFQNLDQVVINQKDADGDILSNWLIEWNLGILKIEDRINPKNFGLYRVSNLPVHVGGNYIFSAMTCLAGNSGITSGVEYLISFVINGAGSSGTSGAPGPSGGGGSSGLTGSSGTSGNGSSGTSGTGISGSSGSSGTSGNGSSGTSGTSGTSGSSGMSPTLFAWVIDTPEVGGIPGPRLYYDMNINRVDSYITDNTGVTFNIEDRPSIGGNGSVEILNVDMTSVMTGVTSSISYNMVADDWIWLNIKSVDGFPDKLVVSISANYI